MSTFRKYRNGQPWTEDEMRQLRLFASEGRSIQEMASLLYRKKGSIMTRLRRVRVEEEEKTEVVSPEREVSVPPGAPMKERGGRVEMDTEQPIVVRRLVFDEEVVPETSSENHQPLVCVFDTETTGLPPYAPVTNSEAWQCIRLVQFAYELYTHEGTFLEKKSVIIQPDGFEIPSESVQFHTITTERAMREGISIHTFFDLLNELVSNRDIVLVAHNAIFDDNVVQSELYRYQKHALVQRWKSLEKECTMMMGKRYVGKVQKLAVLYEACGFTLDTTKALHQADVDTELCARIYFHLRSLSISNLRYNLVSSYQDKEILKYLGAKWDGGQRVWYIYDSEPFSSYVKKWFS